MFKNIIGFGLVAVMLLACFAGIASAEVSYAKTYTDPLDDVEPAQDDDIDATEVKSTLSGDNVLITFKVKGTAIRNNTYSATLNVDGMEAMVANMGSAAYYTNTEIDDSFQFINLTVSGNTATFTVPRSAIDAKTSFDIYEAFIIDGDFNMDTITGGGEDPADDDDDDDTTPSDDDIVSDDDDDDNATDDDTNTTGEESKKKTPGFELIFVMAAAAVVGVVFWIRRK